MATVTTDEWTEEKCLQLIREYRARPILWDPKDLLFFKKNLKPVAWQEISDVIHISPDKCKHKIIILMSSFRREKSKIMHSIRTASDASEVYKSTWFAFKDMAFLMDKENERKRQLNAVEEDGDEHSIPDTVRNYVGPSGSMHKCRRSSPVQKKIVQMVSRSIRKAAAISKPTPGPSQTTEERDDEIKSFTSFIGNKMKKYSDTTKNAVQQAICEVIFKADQHCFESNNCFDKFTIIDDETDPLNRTIYEREEIERAFKVENDSDLSD